MSTSAEKVVVYIRAEDARRLRAEGHVVSDWVRKAIRDALRESPPSSGIPALDEGKGRVEAPPASKMPSRQDEKPGKETLSQMLDRRLGPTS